MAARSQEDTFEDDQYLPDSTKAKRLLRDVLSYKRHSLIVVVTIVLSSAASMIGPLLLGYAVNDIVSRNYFEILIFSGLYAVLYLSDYFAENRRIYHMTMVSQKVIKDLRDGSFQTLQNVPLSFFGRYKTGRIISRITNDAEALNDFLTFQLPQVLAGIIGVIASIAIMVYLDSFLTLISVLIIPVLFGITASLQKRMRRNFLDTRKSIAAVTSYLSESIVGVKVIKGFVREQSAMEKFGELNDNNRDSNLKASRLSSFFGSLVQVVEAIGIAAVLYAGSMQVISGAISIGLLIAFVAYVQGFFNPIVQLSQFYNSYQSAMVGLDRIYRLKDEPSEERFHGAIEFDGIKNDIRFDDVRFAYTDREVIHGISFSVRKGEKVALVGQTGAGKSTIVNLILRFYRPTLGKILIDGTDANNIDLNEYRAKIGVVLQDPFLFRSTVLENIRFASPDKSDKEIQEKINQIGLKEIFERLPKGIYSDVGERGTNVSEGQRQAISIMRAMIKDPDTIIFDEATSQLDAQSEERIQNALSLAMRNKTVFIIAHRLSTIRAVDKIIFVENGEVVEDGKPADLIRRSSRFYDLYKDQIELLT